MGTKFPAFLQKYYRTKLLWKPQTEEIQMFVDIYVLYALKCYLDKKRGVQAVILTLIPGEMFRLGKDWATSLPYEVFRRVLWMGDWPRSLSHANTRSRNGPIQRNLLILWVFFRYVAYNLKYNHCYRFLWSFCNGSLTFVCARSLFIGLQGKR